MITLMLTTIILVMLLLLKLLCHFTLTERKLLASIQRRKGPTILNILAKDTSQPLGVNGAYENVMGEVVFQPPTNKTIYASTAFAIIIHRLTP
jgi:NADH:ubiquinone oxidoreductase subunit H